MDHGLSKHSTITITAYMPSTHHSHLGGVQSFHPATSTQKCLLGIDLRSYQQDGVSWLAQRYVRRHGCILGDEMGLGKTCQTIAFLVYLRGSKESHGPHLILSPLSVLANWQNELARFAPMMKVVSYVGDKDRRSELQEKIHDDIDNISVILSTYELCLKDDAFLKQFEWHTLVVDEAHRLKNRESLLYQSLQEFSFTHRLLLTGTPVQNNLKELYTLLAFVAPKIFRFKHESEFVSHFAQIEPDSEEAKELHSILQPFLLRRIKSEVVFDLPQRSEVVLFHGLSAMQKKYYKAILTKDIGVFDNAYQPTKTRLMNTLMQLRKCVNHPYLFDGVEPEPFVLGEHLVEASGKLVIIDQLLSQLKLQGHKVLMFSQMTHMLDILQDYLGYRGYTYERLDGSVRGEERYLAIQNFNQYDDTFIFLLSTKAGGVGLNLVSADTVIFVDSDFNPQNDLQAAARAHRIGQKRPVKVIRLIGRSTVEEIILRRAEAKLKLTNAVIEGGQFSLGANREALVADNNMQLTDILKFGVDKLLADEDSSVEKMDFEAILGPSRDGEWKWNADEPTQELQASIAMDIEDEAEEGDKNMYVFEGTDYSKTSADDQKAVDKLMTMEKQLVEESTSEGRMRRSKTVTQFFAMLPEVSKKPRKKLTEEEKAARKKKREENAARRAKEEEEEEMRRAQEIRKKLMKRWEAHNYKSLNISMDSEDDEDEDEDEADEVASSDEDENQNGHAINYVVGDVTLPAKAGKRDAFIVHCVDDSGSWGRGGLFTALSNRSDQPENMYTLAGKMKDLALGDCHLIAVDDKQSRDEGHDYVVLIIAQHRDRKNNLSGIKLSALSEGLQRIYRAALKHKASVHLPRIGHNTPGFNWYGTERLIRKHLASKGIPTYIYYYPRRNTKKRKQPSPDPEEREMKRKIVEPSTSDSSAIESRNESHGGLEKSSAGEMDEAVSLGKAASLPSHSDECTQSLKRATTFPPSQMSALPEIHPSDDVSIFDGCCIYLHQLGEEMSKKLTRYIVAYDGDVHKTIEDSTTHIIVHPDISMQLKQELRQRTEEFPEALVVMTQWLELSIIKQQTLPTDKYEVNLMD